jgi:hypothetical protein
MIVRSKEQERPDPGVVTQANPPEPSPNVLLLVAAEAKRNDDLRRAERRLNDAEIRRSDDLRDSERWRRDAAFEWLNKLDDMREKCAKECHAVQLKANTDLAKAETERINGRLESERIRIDALMTAAAQNVTLATTRTESTATALAERVETSAKTLAVSVEASAAALRSQVATTAETIAAQNATKYDALEKRISPLEQARYQTGGREEQRAEGTKGTQWLIPVILSVVFGLVGMLAAIVTIIVAIITVIALLNPQHRL